MTSLSRQLDNPDDMAGFKASWEELPPSLPLPLPVLFLLCPRLLPDPGRLQPVPACVRVLGVVARKQAPGSSLRHLPSEITLRVAPGRAVCFEIQGPGTAGTSVKYGFLYPLPFGNR